MSSRTKPKSTSRHRGQPGRRQTPGLWLLGAGALLILAAVVLAALNAGRSGGTPRLQVDREIIDLGPVRLGQTVSAAFTLTNTGDAPLVFSEPPYIEVRAGC